MSRARTATRLGSALVLLASLLTGTTAATAATAPDTSAAGRKAPNPPALSCVYSAHSVAGLDEYASLVGRPVTCATVFNDTSTNWTQWSTPWFLKQANADLDWAAWVRAQPGRRLVVTQGMFPTSEQSQNWLLKGARGEYASYATTLARNLVAAGLGSSSIRLGNEANGTWYPYSVPSDALGQQRWRTFWARTVTAMRAVPGADFSFVWSVNYQVRDLPLADFYPGNKVVDVIGLDAYDAGSGATRSRYSVMYNRAGGIGDVLAFATARGRPVAFPEWGLMNTGAPHYGGGDDPDYISGMGSFIASQKVAFAGYWYARSDTRTLLQNSPDSLAALRQVVATMR